MENEKTKNTTVWTGQALENPLGVERVGWTRGVVNADTLTKILEEVKR